MFCFLFWKNAGFGFQESIRWSVILWDLRITKPINLWNNSTLTDAWHRAVDPFDVRGCGLETLGRWVDQTVESWYFYDCQYQPHVAGRNEKYHGFAMMFFVFWVWPGWLLSTNMIFGRELGGLLHVKVDGSPASHFPVRWRKVRGQFFTKTWELLINQLSK